MLVELALIIAVVSFLYHHFTKYNNYWKERNVAGPQPTFFFGNFKDVALRKRSETEIYREIFDKYPDEKIVGIFQMRSPNLLVKDLEIIEHIFSKDFDNFTDRDVDFAEQGLECNLVAFNGDAWRALRKITTPFFTPRKLKDIMYLISERGDKIVDYLGKITTEQPNQDAHGMISKYTQACITACGYGLDIDISNSSMNILKTLEPKIYSYSFRAELEMMYPGILKRLKLPIGQKEVVNFFTNLIKDVIAKRNGEPSNRNDFTDFMLGLRKAQRTLQTDVKNTVEITDELMLGQLFLFYAAGYHTSSLAMSFMLQHMAINPYIQDKVLAEIEQVLHKYEGKLTYEAVFELKYMGQVFAETLRLYPVSHILKRRAVADYKVPGTDLTVKKGQIFIVPIPVVHMDPNNYSNPEVFDPERFSPENVASRHSCAYLPFGFGPRKCIGIRLAELQIRIGMAKLLSAFRVEPSDHVPPRFQYKAGFHLQPKDGIPLKFLRR